MHERDEPEDQQMIKHARDRDVTARRSAVVRRLIDRGVSPDTLLIVLPDWGSTITSALTALPPR